MMISRTDIEKAARALSEMLIRDRRRWDTDPQHLEEMLPAAVDANWREHIQEARTAAIAFGLEIIDG